MTCNYEDDCNQPVQARGMCHKHYAHWSYGYKSAGLPLPPKPPRERAEPKLCIIKECGKKAVGRGWCRNHYWHWQQYGDPLKGAERKPKPACAAGECGKPAESKGYCSKHYTRLVRNGDPSVVSYIRGDDQARLESHVNRAGGPEACHPWTGSRDSGGYGQIRIKGDLQLAHVIAWEFEHGPKPPGADMDHECHNRAVREGACKPGKCEHRACCNPAHLVPKTRRQHRDDTRQWEMPTGSRRRLAEDEKVIIRELLAAGHTGRWIAQWLGIHPATVSNVKNNKNRRKTPPEDSA